MVECLPSTRLNLQKEVRSLVKKYGPELGDLYFCQEVPWDQVMKKVRFLHDADADTDNALEGGGVHPDDVYKRVSLAIPPERSVSSIALSDFSVAPMTNDDSSSQSLPDTIIDEVSKKQD